MGKIPSKNKKIEPFQTHPLKLFAQIKNLLGEILNNSRKNWYSNRNPRGCCTAFLIVNLRVK